MSRPYIPYKKPKKKKSSDSYVPTKRFGGGWHDDVWALGLPTSQAMWSRKEREAIKDEARRVQAAHERLFDIKNQNYSADVVRLNSRVTVKINGEIERFMIVESKESVVDDVFSLILFDAPVAEALLGHGVGEKVMAIVPVGELEIEILTILNK